MWPGYNRLKPYSSGTITYPDLVYVYRAFLHVPSLVLAEVPEAGGDAVRVTCHGSIADEIDKIANKLGANYPRDRKVREIARLCLCLLNRLLAGDGEVGGSAEPHKDAAARCWSADDRHAIPDKELLPLGVASRVMCQDYPDWVLCTRRLGFAEPELIKLPLHRFATWLAVGDIPAGKPHATHKCHDKRCVALPHLDWGSAKENKADYLRQANWGPEGDPKRKKRWVGQACIGCHVGCAC